MQHGLLHSASGSVPWRVPDKLGSSPPLTEDSSGQALGFGSLSIRSALSVTAFNQLKLLVYDISSALGSCSQTKMIIAKIGQMYGADYTNDDSFNTYIQGQDLHSIRD
jgi:hypothetical protein